MNRKLTTVRFSKQQIGNLIGPIVYIFWAKRRHNMALYVGVSKHGIKRPMGYEHHRNDVLRVATELEVIKCQSMQEANALEIRLIRALQPRYNGTGHIHTRPVKIMEYADVDIRPSMYDHTTPIEEVLDPTIYDLYKKYRDE